MLGAVLSAIAAHPNLRYRLQNTEGETHAVLIDTNYNLTIFNCFDPTAAIALLTVYLQWLEARK